MDNFDARWIPVALGIALVVNVLILVYVSYFKVEEAESYLAKCEWIDITKKTGQVEGQLSECTGWLWSGWCLTLLAYGISGG
ncbi:MAG: hypothetical protein ACOH2R_01425 [Pseudomonas sp.]